MRRAVLCLIGLLWAESACGQLPDSLRTLVATDTWQVYSYTTEQGECTEVLVSDSPRGVMREYYASGLLKSYTSLTVNGARRIPFGVATSWYENGQLWTRRTYAYGQVEGEFMVYYPDGSLKRQTTYAEGKELIGNCFGPDGQPVPYTVYELPPLYPGGPARLEKDLTRHIHIPPRLDMSTTIKLLVQGLEVIFQVAEDGSIHDTHVLGGLGPGIETMVQQAIYQLPKSFRSGQRDGQPVASYYRLAIEPNRLPGVSINLLRWAQ